MNPNPENHVPQNPTAPSVAESIANLLEQFNEISSRVPNDEPLVKPRSPLLPELGQWVLGGAVMIIIPLLVLTAAHRVLNAPNAKSDKDEASPTLAMRAPLNELLLRFERKDYERGRASKDEMRSDLIRLINRNPNLQKPLSQLLPLVQ